MQPLALQGGWAGGMQPGMMMGAAGWHISLEWTEDEQRTLEDHLARFPPERFDALTRYIKLAAMLPRKSVRDVALRCKWTINQQLLRKRKLEQAGKGPMGVAPKKPGGPGAGPGRPVMPMPLPVPAVGAHNPGSMPPPFLPPGAQPAGAGGAAGSSSAAAAAADGGMIVDGPIAQLLESNYGILNTFRANMAAFKVAENTQLLMQFRDNILNIISHMENMGGVMDQMPQLPVRLNVDLANNFLPSRSTFPTPAYASGGGGMPPQPAVNIPGMVPLNGIAPGSNAAPQLPPPSAAAAPPPAAPAAGFPPPPVSEGPTLASMPGSGLPTPTHARSHSPPSAAAAAAAVVVAAAASQVLPVDAAPAGAPAPAAPALPAVKQEPGVKEEPGVVQPMGPARAATPPNAAPAAPGPLGGVGPPGPADPAGPAAPAPGPAAGATSPPPAAAGAGAAPLPPGPVPPAAAVGQQPGGGPDKT